MYQRGKPFVGAKVFLSDRQDYYDVVAVTPTTYTWKSSITGNTYVSENHTFLQDGEPYYTPTDCLKALKNEISKGIPGD